MASKKSFCIISSEKTVLFLTIVSIKETTTNDEKTDIALIFMLSLCGVTSAQTSAIPAVRINQGKILFYNSGSRDDFNIRGKLPATFEYSVPVAKEGTTCAVVSEEDSLPVFIQPGKTTRFYLVQATTKDSMLCQFTGIVKRATFTDAYKKANQGKIGFEVPEVYELVNVLFAITHQAQQDENIVNKHTAYYQSVQKAFGAYRKHPAVLVMDSLLKQGQYTSVKMNSYAFVFKENRIISDGIYDRVSGDDRNTLLTHIPLLETFARESGFRTFYQKNSPYYQDLRKQMQAQLPLSEMKRWLERNFPATRYDFVKAIFSPLVSGHQSAYWFSDNGFSEAQMHINALHKDEWAKGMPENVVKGQLSIPAFTELNHAFINPEAEKHALDSFKDLSKWTAGKFSKDYQNQFACFTEYMNWALASLYFLDSYPTSDFNILKENLENTMVNHRGFSKFKEFNNELLRLYQQRKPGATVADLYAPLLAWAQKQ
jgi:hypothetical protein